jgi:scyllo-inositol 2-dehydrogenase (NADP+)
VIRVGLVGYGLAGAVFHAPLIRACKRMEISAVLTSRDAPCAVRDLDSLLDRSELVVVASPNATHFEISKAALQADKHVVVDKPFTTSAAQAEELIDLAAARGRKLTVFQNRRWDSDYLTVRSVLPRLGEVHLFEAHWDRFRPEIRDSWKEQPDEANGLLGDLGSHLIDQALQLFGTPEAVQADLAKQRTGAQVDDYFALTLFYGERRVLLSASTLAAAPRPRFAIYGTLGSFVRYGLDPQEAQLKDGADPLSPAFGVDQERGCFMSPDGDRELIQTCPGEYLSFYEQVADAVLSDGAVPVAPDEALEVMGIIELAKQSAREGRRIHVTGERLS